MGWGMGGVGLFEVDGEVGDFAVGVGSGDEEGAVVVGCVDGLVYDCGKVFFGVDWLSVDFEDDEVFYLYSRGSTKYTIIKLSRWKYLCLQS